MCHSGTLCQCGGTWVVEPIAFGMETGLSMCEHRCNPKDLLHWKWNTNRVAGYVRKVFIFPSSARSMISSFFNQSLLIVWFWSMSDTWDHIYVFLSVVLLAWVGTEDQKSLRNTWLYMFLRVKYVIILLFVIYLCFHGFIAWSSLFTWIKSDC